MKKQRNDANIPVTPESEKVRPIKPVVPAPEIENQGAVGRFLEERLRISAFNYSVPKHANTIWNVLGGTAFVSLLLLIASGILMTQLYNPTVDGAHESIKYITEEAPLGWFVRGIHHWAANLMFVVLLLHIGRVIIGGSYKKPREITYFVGLILVFLVFTMVYTGTIVKWDQEGFEALLHFVGIGGLMGYIGSAFAPSSTPSTHILSRIYAMHISIIPITMAVLIAVHFYLIKVLKVAPMPWKPPVEQTETSTYSKHLKLLAKTGLGATALIMVLALVFRPAFGDVPVNMETGIKPPWLFLWVYALENLVGLAGVLYGTIGVFGTLALFPFIDRGEEGHPLKRPLAMALLAVLVITLVVLSVMGYLSPPVVHSQM